MAVKFTQKSTSVVWFKSIIYYYYIQYTLKIQIGRREEEMEGGKEGRGKGGG